MHVRTTGAPPRVHDVAGADAAAQAATGGGRQRPLRALVIAPQPFFTPRGTPFSVYYRTLVTAQLGCDVDLLTYGEGRDVDIPGARLVRIPRLPGVREVKVGPSFMKLFLDIFMILWTIGLLLRRRYDFVHAHEEAVFWARALQPIFRFKLVYDMHSSLPQQLTNFKFTTSKLLIGTFRVLEDWALRGATAVITICPDLAEYASRRVSHPSRHFLIENSIYEPVRLPGGRFTGRPDTGVDTSEEPRAPGVEVLPAGRPVVVYAGTFEPYQGVDILLEAFARVRERRPDAFLLLVGGTLKQVEDARERAASLGLPERDCRFTGRVDQAVARHYTASATVLTSPRTRGTNTPLKVYEQLDSGIPLVATRIYSHTQVLDDDVCILVEPTPDGLAEGILAALDDRDRRERVVAGARALYERRYARPVYEAKMRQLLELIA
jgi:glycosyltransferase involved in cell wall biosynthesis